MKTTLDLPEPLLRKAQAVAARQGRTLDDLVAEALAEKLTATAGIASNTQQRANEWIAFESTLVRLPDGSVMNPNGIEGEGFFADVEAARPHAFSALSKLRQLETGALTAEWIAAAINEGQR